MHGQRLEKLTKKATHCHPFYKNCAHLVTQLSYTKSLRRCRKEERGTGGRGPLDFAGIENRTVQSVQNYEWTMFILLVAPQIFHPSIITEVTALKLSKNTNRSKIMNCNLLK